MLVNFHLLLMWKVLYLLGSSTTGDIDAEGVVAVESTLNVGGVTTVSGASELRVMLIWKELYLL